MPGQLAKDEPLIHPALGLHVIDVREAEYRRGRHGRDLVADEPLPEQGCTARQDGHHLHAGGDRTLDSAQDPLRFGWEKRKR